MPPSSSEKLSHARYPVVASLVGAARQLAIHRPDGDAQIVEKAQLP